MLTIGILGGSFDPIHRGHLEMGRQAIKALSLDQLLFIPSKQSPMRANKHFSSFKDRSTMVKLAIENKPKCHLSNIEESLPCPSYAINTIKALRSEYPEAQFYWIIGQDQAEKLDQWHQIEELTKLVTFAYFPRTDQSSGQKKISSHTIKIEKKIPQMSSSDIRAVLKTGQPPSSSLPDKVCKYIAKHSLYV